MTTLMFLVRRSWIAVIAASFVSSTYLFQTMNAGTTVTVALALGDERTAAGRLDG